MRGDSAQGPRPIIGEDSAKNSNPDLSNRLSESDAAAVKRRAILSKGIVAHSSSAFQTTKRDIGILECLDKRMQKKLEYHFYGFFVKSEYFSMSGEEWLFHEPYPLLTPCYSK